jgi:two-component system OmpR family sensor kinase
MKIGLFWKITAGFWLTLLGITQGIWLLVVLTNPIARGGAAGFIERYLSTEITAPALALRLGGRPALDELLASWTPEERRRLSVVDAGSAPAQPITVIRAAGGKTWQAQTVVAGPGRRWRVTYRYPTKRGSTAPVEVWGVAALGGLVFSAVLAWYLTLPIRRLRAGFDSLARGEMTVRLRPSMGRRRDEIADLGRDFDLMAERLQQLVGARDRLLHDVSHELRSPLARLQTAIGLARQRPERTEAAMQRIELESRRLDELVGELLTLSRAEGAAPFAEQYLDIAELVRTVAADAGFEAEPRQVRVETSIADPQAFGEAGATVRGSAELLRRGLENVVRNALRFSAPGQVVSIDMRPGALPHTAHIEIRDQGPGAPAQTMQTMFDPFVRLHDQPLTDGFGLGLSIARRAILAHGGTIEVENLEPSGLSISICLPLQGAG